MGIVYEAHDHSRRERVALKTVLRVDSSTLLRLKREFRALQGIEHPNLVRLHELVEEAGRWFFTMELISGTDLLRHVRGGEPVGERTVSVEGPIGTSWRRLENVHSPGRVVRSDR